MYRHKHKPLYIHFKIWKIISTLSRMFHLKSKDCQYSWYVRWYLSSLWPEYTRLCKDEDISNVWMTFTLVLSGLAWGFSYFLIIILITIIFHWLLITEKTARPWSFEYFSISSQIKLWIKNYCSWCYYIWRIFKCFECFYVS